MRIGVAGLGTVGVGLLKLLAANESARKQEGLAPILVTGVSARTREKDRGVSLAGAAWWDDARDLATSDDIDVFVELIGGSEGVAKDAVLAAIAAGKHVVTANKALIAENGRVVSEAAEEAGVGLFFEAAVAGGAPVVRIIRDALAPTKIQYVSGILNGTCNYILSEMERTGRPYADILSDAQELGYAEADPSFDVGGIDAAHKLAILASLCFGTTLSFSDVVIDGIDKVSSDDVAFAAEVGCRIKSVAYAGLTDDGALAQRVQSTLVPLEHPLAAVNGVFNAVTVDADPVGRLMIEGRGAGEGPTAAAVASDLYDIASGRFAPPLGAPIHTLRDAAPAPDAERVSRYYLRLTVFDLAGVAASVTETLAEHSVSIETMLQKPPAGAGEEDASPRSVPMVIVTHPCPQRALRTAVAKMSDLGFLAAEPSVFPVESA
ncbi:MAG: homoserine dehydrogenase [Pseudomonadota bacterium]